VAVLPIIVAPDPRLKKVAEPVRVIDAEIRQLMDDMLETMYQAPGIGLAAPQVGVLKRVIVLDVSPDGEKPAPLRMADPRVIEASGDIGTYEEGCLSLPDQFAEVRRPTRITVSYLDETGASRHLEAEGLLATCIQHEIDHLEGVLFVDHISRLKRDMILKRLVKNHKTGSAADHSTAPVL